MPGMDSGPNVRLYESYMKNDDWRKVEKRLSSIISEVIFCVKKE